MGKSICLFGAGIKNIIFNHKAMKLLKQKFKSQNYDISTSDINFLEKSQIHLYFNMPKILPKKEDIEKSFLLLFEPETTLRENFNLKKHTYFKKIFTCDDDLIKNNPKRYIKLNLPNIKPHKIENNSGKKFCCLIAGNKFSLNIKMNYIQKEEKLFYFLVKLFVLSNKQAILF